MSTTDNSGPAFPVPVAMCNGGAYSMTGSEEYVKDGMGMTMRDYFAAKALAGMWANPAVTASAHIRSAANPGLEMAKNAYEQADAMLSARAHGGKEGA